MSEGRSGGDEPLAELYPLVGLAPSSWMMTACERTAMLGVLQALRPGLSLECGCAKGGLTYCLSRFSKAVVTVDVAPTVEEVAQGFRNVTAMRLKTEDASRQFRNEGRRFDLAVIDADHTRAGVARGLDDLIPVADVIVLHDSYHPACRAGMEDVLRRHDVFADLDFVPGGVQPDGLWGGLGLVITGKRRTAAQPYVTPRRSTYRFSRTYWLGQQLRRKLIGRVGRLRRLIPGPTRG